MADSCRVTTEPTKLRTYYNEKAKGDLVVWGFDLEGQGAVELHKKPGNDPPAVNTMILVEDRWKGEFDGETYTRIKLANEAGASGGGGPRGRSPADTKAIQRQHSQGVAIQTVALAIQHEFAHPQDTRELFDLIEKTTDHFDDDIKRGVERAS